MQWLLIHKPESLTHCREGREEGGGEGEREVREETGQTSELPLSQKRPESMLRDEGDTIKSLCVCPLVKKQINDLQCHIFNKASKLG